MKITSNLNLAIILSFTILIVSCSKKLSSNQELKEETTFVKSTVLILQDGTYTDLNLETKPIPSQGEDQFYRDMYLKLRYPANARENDIQGTVMFEVDINEKGQVGKIVKANSLSAECDREAQGAIERGCSKGFIPYEYNGEAVKVKYLIPVNFRLR